MQYLPDIIAVDFDGTCVTHEYPEVGRDIGAVPLLRSLSEMGCKLILWTMRSDKPLEDAVEWFKSHGIPLFGVNTNPQQHVWTNSPKAYAKLYIDDAALGIPLKAGEKGERPYVDWQAVTNMLMPVICAEADTKAKQPNKDSVHEIRDVLLKEGDWAVECSNPGHFLKVHPSEFGKPASSPAYSYFRPIESADLSDEGDPRTPSFGVAR
jgi:hypothetical protein